MAYLGGPIGPRRRRGIYLHDPPPGYHPPRPRLSLKNRQRQARQEQVLMRVARLQWDRLLSLNIYVAAMHAIAHSNGAGAHIVAFPRRRFVQAFTSRLRVRTCMK
jgi:hypothetical protein